MEHKPAGLVDQFDDALQSQQVPPARLNELVEPPIEFGAVQRPYCADRHAGDRGVVLVGAVLQQAGSMRSAFFRSNAPTASRISGRSMAQRSVEWMRANGLSRRARPSPPPDRRRRGRSLFSRITSAKAICSRASSCSSWTLSTRVDHRNDRIERQVGSDDLIQHERLDDRGRIGQPGCFQDETVDRRSLSRIRSTAPIRSPRTVQQMQPLLSSTTLSPVSTTSWPSISISPNSLTITAIFSSRRSVRMRLSSVACRRRGNP